MYVKIADHLSSVELYQVKNKDKPSNDNSNERLSSRALAELQGTNPATYKRVRGASGNK